MLLLHERPEMFAGISPDQMQRVIAKYVEWRSNLISHGRLSGGNKLRDEPGKVLEPNAGHVVVRDGPYIEAKDVIGGYFLISADSYEAAVETSRQCPHLDFGGTIELREIEPTGP
jgi:hypothetical protein